MPTAASKAKSCTSTSTTGTSATTTTTTTPTTSRSSKKMTTSRQTTISTKISPSLGKVLDHYNQKNLDDIIINTIPPLQEHHVVLGRYLGSKTKPLNDATRIYRDIRKTTKRTKHFATAEIAALKQTLSERLRTELNSPTLPDVVFVVDVHKADDSNKLQPFLRELKCSKKDNGKEDIMEEEDGTTERCLVQKLVPTSSSSSEVIIFMADEGDDHFLKADLDSKKRPGARHVTPASVASASTTATPSMGGASSSVCASVAVTVASDCTSVTTNASACKKRKHSSSIDGGGGGGHPQQRNLVSPLQSMDSSSSYGKMTGISGAPAPYATTAAISTPSVISCSTARTIKTDTSSLTDDRTTATAAASSSSKPAAAAAAAEGRGKVPFKCSSCSNTPPSGGGGGGGRFQLRVVGIETSIVDSGDGKGTSSSDTTTTLDELEEQAHQICEDWIRQEDTTTSNTAAANKNGRSGSGSGLEAMLRKASMVQSFQSYISHYKKKFQHNPFINSPMPFLRHMNEQQYAAIVNTLGNSMMDWYTKHPTTCLEGEANSWTGGVVTGLQKADDHHCLNDDYHDHNQAMSDVDGHHPHHYHYYSDVVGMEQGSIGTYSSLELEFLPSLTFCGSNRSNNQEDLDLLEEDGGVSDIVQCFEEFSMGSSTNRTIHSRVVGVRQPRGRAAGAKQPQQPTATSAIRNEWSPVVREHNNYSSNHQDDDDATNNATTSPTLGGATKQLPPRWTSKSRQLFQKRQQGHQFLQKQLRRFRNKKSSSSSSTRPSSASTSLRRSSGSSKKKKSKTTKTATAMTSSPTTAVSATSAATHSCSANPAIVSNNNNNNCHTVRVSTKEELSLLYRRLRHNDPTLKEAIVDFDIAQKEAKELIRVLGLSFYDWDMHRRGADGSGGGSSSSSDNDDDAVVSGEDNDNSNEFMEQEGGDEATNNRDTATTRRRSRSNKNAFIVLKRSESSDWEDSTTR